ncbi:MAG: glycosyltransferase family 4 protein [Homoserinimonas sp.]
MTKVLILTGDPIGARMAGPAIRSWNMASLLSRENEVTLVTTTILEEVEAPFTLRRIKPGENSEFNELERWADVIVFQGHAMNQFEVLRTTSKIVVVDIYDPMHLEMLEQGRELPRATWQLRVDTATRVLNEQLALGDFFLCASERQRLFYLGQLAALGRVNPATYETDPHFARLLAVAPFGLDATPPVHQRAVLKDVVPGIGGSDKLLLWGGGLYSWFDPKSLIRAVAELSRSRENVSLYFLGTKHPGVEEMGIVRESFDLARELGALGSSVHFNEDWVDYAERQNYLAEADAGVSTHMSHIETTFSFRTRILDYLWGSLPMVVTEGDSFAELVEKEGLGLVVPAGDVPALTEALERILFDEKFLAQVRVNLARVREQFFWERALQPLVEFVRHPQHAADYAGARQSASTLTGNGRKPYGLRHDASMAVHHLRHSGVRVTVTKLANRLFRKR